MIATSLVIDAMLTLIKFSSHLAFIDVGMRDHEAYERYRHILLQKHPLKSPLTLPTYFLVNDLDSEAQVLAEMAGAMPEQEFRSRLESTIQTIT
jgi:hypothetical protein